jgi:dihydrolipoamide dehydrogenase
MAEQDYDLIVIGAGPGGYVAAIRAAQLGLKTACVESRETLGGTCLNVGCIPSKAMLHASELYDEAQRRARQSSASRLQGRTRPRPDAGRKAEAVKELTGGIEFLFKKNKVDWLKGHAAFTSPNSVDRRAKAIHRQEHRDRHRLVVTPLPGVEVDNEGVIVDSTGALALDPVPKHLVVIGGGVIGLELGSVWRRLGRKGHRGRISRPDAARHGRRSPQGSAKIFKKQGMNSSSRHQGHRRHGQGQEGHTDVEPAAGGAAKRSRPIACSSPSAAARIPKACLDKAGLTVNARGQIETDHDFRTSVPGIWAIGDVIPGPMLAHKAEDEGIAVPKHRRA